MPSPSPVFFFNDTATTEIYTLSLHDALPISGGGQDARRGRADRGPPLRDGPRRHGPALEGLSRDRKSTRLNSSHSQISYAVFCLKKKNEVFPVPPCKLMKIRGWWPLLRGNRC